jgi:glycosyltransferase involved in cell wall biosynthesis
MVPNFVDTDRFTPGDQQRARAAFSLPPHSLVVLCCAAIRRHHKRVDYLLAEFGRALHLTSRDMILVIAGGREADTDRIIADGRALLGDRVRFLTDLPRHRMPDLYRAADVFTLASLHEMFGIVLIEAMASGLPVVCHDAPGLRSVVGPAGHYANFSVPGGLAGALTSALDPQVHRRLSCAARPQAEDNFGEKVVIRDILAMYRQVLSEPADG